MKARRLSVGGWVRLCVTLLAVTCMAAGAVAPVQAWAHDHKGASPVLRVLGAVLCHSDGRPGHHAPGKLPFRDRCPCGVAALHTPVPTDAVAIVAPFEPRAEARPPGGSHTHAMPRAPPDFAHNPRAPPIA
jgi:hypothetical protein